MQKLETSNPIICGFYKSNPTFDFEAMNLILIDMLKNVVKNTKENQNELILTQLHEFQKMFSNNITELNSKIDNQHKSLTLEFEAMKTLNNLSISNNQKDIINIKEILGQMNTINNSLSSNISNELVIKFDEFKKSYIESLKSYVEHIINQNSDVEKSVLNKQIESCNKILLTNVENLIKDTIPENQILLKDFFDNKCQTLITNAQQPLLTLITNSNEKIQSIHTMNTNISQHFDKQQNSSIKGAISENKLNDVLTNMFPSCDIVRSANEKCSGDYIVRREETIMFENKDYERNVPPDEVKKFMRDINELNCHGIFLSQKSGITLKPNFHIDIYNKNILVYIHYVNYDKEKINCAVQLIDTLAPRIRSVMDNSGTNTIQTEILEEINKEFNIFVEKKEMLLTISKDYLKKLSNVVAELQFPMLEKYLGTKYASPHNQNLKCKICNLFVGKSNKSLAKHQQSCAKKMENIIVVN